MSQFETWSSSVAIHALDTTANTGELGRMDAASRAQVRLILGDSAIRAGKEVDTRVKAIYTTHAAKGLLRSGGTIKAVVSAVEEIATALVTRCVDRVAPVAKDIEAFALVQETVEGFLRSLPVKIDQTARLASGGDGLDRILEAARALFRESQASVRRQVEIHRFAFTVPQSSLVNAGLPNSIAGKRPSAPQPEKNRGGKPLAEHWDGMWAAIAGMLYVGDLQPKTQADIERAMKDWLMAQGLDVGDTSVRDRARRLWAKLLVTE